MWFAYHCIRTEMARISVEMRAISYVNQSILLSCSGMKRTVSYD